MSDLILDVFVTELQLHDVLKRPEESFIKMKVWQLCPAAQNLHQNIMDEGHSLLGYMSLFMTGRLWEQEKKKICYSQYRKKICCYLSMY